MEDLHFCLPTSQHFKCEQLQQLTGATGTFITINSQNFGLLSSVWLLVFAESLHLPASSAGLTLTEPTVGRMKRILLIRLAGENIS